MNIYEVTFVGKDGQPRLDRYIGAQDGDDAIEAVRQDWLGGIPEHFDLAGLKLVAEEVVLSQEIISRVKQW